MADRAIPITLTFNGGYATDLPTQARQLKYFLNAQNVVFDVDGSARKAGGATAINGTAITDGPDVVGMFDYWRAGTSGSWAQKFVAVTGDGKVYKEDMDGTFDDITGAATISAGVVPVFCVATDLLCILTSACNTPLKWNQSGNVASLGGTPPAGKGMVFHRNRGWIWGTNANPSTIYYSAYGNVEDWTGIDTGGLDVDINDGDVIIGAVSYMGSLIIFKGPNYGSIHSISGSSPSNFSRDPFVVRGIPLQSHNSIVPVEKDILFWSDRGIHSLKSVQQYGNFAPADLTRFLRGHFRNYVNRTAMNKVWGLDYKDKNCALWTYTASSGSENDSTLGLSYVRVQEDSWKPFTWTRGGISAALRIHPTTKAREVVYGTTNGFALREDVAARSLPSNTAYSFRMTTPHLLLGSVDAQGKQTADQPVNLQRMYLRSQASGNWDVSIAVTRDDNPAETYTFNQGMTGFLLGTSVLGTGSLGAERMQITYSDPPIAGQARTVQLDITQGGLNEDANLLEIGIEVTPAAQSSETSLNA